MAHYLRWRARALLFVASLLLPCVTLGAPLPCSFQPDWGDYPFAFPDGCTIGDKLFSNFDATSTVGNIFRAPTFPSPVASADGVGFDFDFTLLDNSASSPVFAGATQTKSFVIAVSAAVQPAGRLIAASLFSLTGLQLTGTGTIDALEVICPLGTFSRPVSSSSSCSSGPTAQAGVSAPQLSATANFSPAEAVDIIMSITLSGGSNGSARINGLRLQIADVPEPSMLVLLGTAVAALMLTLRRRRGRLMI